MECLDRMTSSFNTLLIEKMMYQRGDIPNNELFLSVWQLSHLAIWGWGSVLSWFVFLTIYSHFWPTLNMAAEMVGMVRTTN